MKCSSQGGQGGCDKPGGVIERPNTHKGGGVIKRGCDSTSEHPQGVFGGVITVEPLLPHT